LRIKVARIFNTYGPRMHPNDGRVVSNFILQALLGRDITIYGDGSQTRSFCYVDDLIDGLVRLMATEDQVTGPVNIGNPTKFTILELASQIINMTGSSSRIVHRPFPDDDPQQRQPDISCAWCCGLGVELPPIGSDHSGRIHRESSPIPYRKLHRVEINFLLSPIKGIQPRDRVEGMLTSQMATVLMTSMSGGQLRPGRRHSAAGRCGAGGLQARAARSLSRWKRSSATKLAASRRSRCR
jgi:hypothetical protein